jgi:putative tryptophan/tyrosine transport system substrate-binding protein
MRRRDFITLLGGAATWPLAAPAQQPAMQVIGFLHARSPEDFAPQLTALRRGLAENGFTEGQSITIEYRWARGQYDRMPAMAAELVRLPAGLILTGAEPSVLAAKAATSTIPIVFVVGTDPVKLGVVTSFNRPGGNATGVHILATSLEAKRLGLLHELVPHADLIGVLLNPNLPAAQDQLGQLRAAASALGLPIKVLHASNTSEIDGAFGVVAREHVPAEEHGD